jgi:hypothetical protein
MRTGMSSVFESNTSLLTIREFCNRQKISQTTYCRLKRNGLGPREIDLGGNIIRIRPEDEVAWRAARAFPSGIEASAIRARNERRRSKGRWSASSEKHIANVGRGKQQHEAAGQAD